MKESNFLAGNATTKQQQKEILLSTKEDYMKESDTLAGNVAGNAFKGVGRQNIYK